MKKILTGCLCIVILMACQQQGSNENVYDFRLESLNHQRFYLNQYQGSPLILVFWATHCSICKVELSQFNQSMKQLKDKGFRIASVVIDPENKSDLNDIAEKLKLSFPILLDRQQSVFTKFGLKAVPTTLIIDEKGAIAFNVEGYDPSIQQRIYKRIGIQ